MSKPIKLTEEVINQMVDDFKNKLQTSKMFNGHLEYRNDFKSFKTEGIRVDFSDVATAKMLALVMTNEDEVGWHGTVQRVSQNVFLITDIFIYPQVVTGATITTDQKEYSEWLYSFNDEDFNTMRFHGHSHVNMATTPSSTDTTHQEKILNELNDNDFYIFAIVNKKLDINIRVFDLANNIQYDRDDIEVTMCGIDIEEFVNQSKKSVSKSTPKYTANKKQDSTPSYYSTNYPRYYSSWWED